MSDDDENLNPFEVLKIDPNSNANEIKKAFRLLAKKMHPDRNPNDTNAKVKFNEITLAYEKALKIAISRSKTKKSNYSTFNPKPYAERPDSSDNYQDKLDFWANWARITYVFTPILMFPLIIFLIYIFSFFSKPNPIESKFCSPCYHTIPRNNKKFEDEDLAMLQNSKSIWTYEYNDVNIKSVPMDFNSQKLCQTIREADPICFPK